MAIHFVAAAQVLARCVLDSIALANRQLEPIHPKLIAQYLFLLGLPVVHLLHQPRAEAHPSPLDNTDGHHLMALLAYSPWTSSVRHTPLPKMDVLGLPLMERMLPAGLRRPHLPIRSVTLCWMTAEAVALAVPALAVVLDRVELLVCPLALTVPEC